MTAGIIKKSTLMLLATGLTLAVLSPAAEINLPDIGSPADATLSKNDEAGVFLDDAEVYA